MNKYFHRTICLSILITGFLYSNNAVATEDYDSKNMDPKVQ